ncbi:type II/IV secretion system protein [Candidatus Berkelbacteria bacterium]|nr:type II/IV secretion system protein [Candidatus Berkelbacteria bacterium]
MFDVRSMVQNVNRDEEEREAQALAERLRLQYVNLVDYPFSRTILHVIPEESISKYLLIPYLRAGANLKLATPNPENPDLSRFLNEFGAAQGMALSLAVCSGTSFSYARKLIEIEADKAPSTPAVSEQKNEVLANFQDRAGLAQRLSAVSTTEIMDVLFAGAVAMRATDIHIEPAENKMTARFRIDGVLQTIAEVSFAQYRLLRSRIKYLAQLKLDVIDTPQDGRFEYRSLDKKFDVRVSSLPTGYGETFVLRLLTGGSAKIKLDDLGFTPEQAAVIRTAISKPNGLILNTGPTGSGKTTTLYAILSELNKPGVKIITIEDPIEYRVEGVQQSQIDHEKNYDFPAALRSILRQDPDIIMVGEIRDAETATIAVQASLTGHLVLATLHTNSAAGAIPRLLDMGVKTYLLSGVINLIIAQRLVRRLENPNGVGDERYKGRIAIAELLTPNPELETLIQQKASIDAFNQASKRAGMISLFEDGMQKVKLGLTTEEEIHRVATDASNDAPKSQL